MWYFSSPEDNFLNREYLAIYPDVAIDQLQDALITTLGFINGIPLGETDEQELHRVLLGLLGDIRKAKFISTGFPEKINKLILEEAIIDKNE